MTNVTATLTAEGAYALRAAVDALVERDRELPAGDPHRDPTWRLTRMAEALLARSVIDSALDAANAGDPATTHLIEWTHDDGMDQHHECADLTPEQALTVRALLEDRGAIDVHVYEPMPGTFAELVETIDADLPAEVEA